MGKIAEHIAKFNAPKDAEFYWVSFHSLDKANEYRENLDLDNLCVKDPNGYYKHVTGAQLNFSFAVKHEQKGEQMKSIELSEEEIVYIRGILNNHMALYNTSIHSPDIAMGIVYQLENAKPITTEPRWSEVEIEEILKREGWGNHIIDAIIKDLKTPKPILRDRNSDEMIEWFNEFDRSQISVFHFKPSLPSYEWGDVFDFCINPTKYKFYRTSIDSPWLPIPQIEIESEK